MSSEVVQPAFYDLLSAQDQIAYNKLQMKVGSPENRYNRNKRLVTFQEILNEIRNYCEHDIEDSWKRHLACGICWLASTDIAINTRQLKLLIAKSKSSINGAFAKMGYETIPPKSEESAQLIRAIPFLKGHFNELRQWTIRHLSHPLSPVSKLELPVIKKNENGKKISTCCPIIVNELPNSIDDFDCPEGPVFTDSIFGNDIYHEYDDISFSDKSENLFNYEKNYFSDFQIL